MIYIVMGVSGAGKTLIGQKLADQLDLPFHDADEFHPPENIKKMESGQPLNDDDRRPWLLAMASQMEPWEQEGGAVLACSALKKSYRQLMKNNTSADIQFIFLKGEKSLIHERMERRRGHFMPPGLLDSQFETLEEPEQALIVSIDQSPEDIIREIQRNLFHKP